MTNFDLSLHIFDFLKQAQVETVVVCAGARNAPMVLALQGQGFKTINFFEERSAAFFALGVIKAHNRPVAVMTTSGTAVAEMLPAAVEATYQCLPLILISADRPRSYRGSGAPQSIEQIGIFSHYVENSYDLDAKTTDFQFVWSQSKPLHLNVCFDEPLIDKPTGKKAEVKLKPPSEEEITAAGDISGNIKQPLIILGELEPKYRDKIRDFILRTKAPVYAESISQMRTLQGLETYMMTSCEQLVRHAFSQKLCQSVIRIGGVPTLRFWRDLETDFKTVPVLNYTDRPYTGLSRPTAIAGMSRITGPTDFLFTSLIQIRQMDMNMEQEKETLLQKYPDSEPAMVHRLSRQVAADPVYLGNSLPIRNWDQFANVRSSLVAANRGANGIDGQVSTYLGWSEAHERSYCLIGDLTAMYDLAALALTPQLNKNRRFVVVMNNGGGQIFNRVFKNDGFINAHDTQFSNWAAMWGWDYLQITKSADASQIGGMSKSLNIVEMIPDMKQTKAFWEEWDKKCQQPLS